MFAKFLLSLLALALQLLAANATLTVKSSCSGVFPVVDTSGPGCSIPDFVDAEQFGDNLQSSGRLSIKRTPRGTRLRIQVDGLSRPDLVLTSWIIWADPAEGLSEVFNVASIVSPTAPSSGGFTSGLGSEANSLRYVSKTRAVLRTTLDFDPTMPNSGPLVGARPTFQSDIPGIEDTPFAQFEAADDGREIPVGANFLRVFDPETGFQKLDADGRPELVRSPNSALGIAVVAHIDRTTHGIHPGLLDTDHFEVLFFDLARFGRRSRKRNDA